ncbi:DUF3883 domain-containing protein [Agrobacterium sp. InxBP2]|uniref:DUF3883 domain-containing protein n=1 Tax=Agrobacterium sp. InxBP2 TaxID=2870329 RepID=UPI00249E888D|nr:DUF3883 domain-containing protein [Agrobacterium sp. InxBP2]MCW8283563.1 DUF3883 domain-containing protein [Agrobacterium sp. InxBP2]
MIPINDADLFERSLEILQDSVGRRYLGRIVQIFLACKQMGNGVPQVGDPMGLTTGQIEEILDDLYRKPSRTSDYKILILFENEFKVASRQLGGTLTSPSNIWRNNLNFQKGYMCYGTVTEFQDRTFLLQSRTLCPHLDPVVPKTLRGAGCKLKPGAKYRNEDHAKVFRKDPSTDEYFIHDLSDVEFYRNIVRPNNGDKLPIVPLIIALYYDSSLAAGRVAVSLSDFLADFDFSPKEASEYFEDSQTSAAHTAILATGKITPWVEELVHLSAPVSAALPSTTSPVPTPKTPSSTKTPSTNATNKTAKTSLPPKGGFWWNAEQAVRDLLVADGWTVMDVSRMGVGCDFKATKDSTLKLIEVKSSAGPCAPVLTKKEYYEACHNRSNYVLAIVENFLPTAALTVQWVHDPASLQVTERLTKEYYLPRSVWKPHKLDSV